MDQCDKEPTSLTLDDYLDLLSLAIRLEDRKWQADIVCTLRHMQEPQGEKQAKSAECTEQELWQCMNQINDRMFALYNELKATDDKDMQRKLLDQMWELKIARVEVFRKIRSIY
ncbi:hypothetical protein GNF98_16150 [Clostridium perfringens]|uniref:hypothetical protein n=1 Tax=Paenibacillus lautus TaxID=1401 RepID=UPI001B001F97|nr:hypothetical protein [Paenibacillus lautus]GIO95257.1 hypothetical protein J14TS5_03430 [Paenibacillus lautus]